MDSNQLEASNNNNYIFCESSTDHPHNLIMLSKVDKLLDQILNSKYPLIVCLHSQSPNVFQNRLHQIRDKLHLAFVCLKDVHLALEIVVKEQHRQTIFLFPQIYQLEVSLIKQAQNNLVGLICYDHDSQKLIKDSENFGKFVLYTNQADIILKELKNRNYDKYRYKTLSNFISLRDQVHKSNISMNTNYLMQNIKLAAETKAEIIDYLRKLSDKLGKQIYYFVADSMDQDGFFETMKSRSLTVKECFEWYTKQTFIYKLLNCLLRASIDPCSIFYLQPYYQDFSNAIKNCHKYQKQSKRFSQFICYRGGDITPAEIQTLKNNLNLIVQNLGFLSTSKNIQQAIKFRGNVFFIIHVRIDNQKDEYDAGYAQTTQFSQYSDELQILFHPLNSFKITSLKLIQNQASVSYYEIEMEYGQISKIFAKDEKQLSDEQVKFKYLADIQLQKLNQINCQGNLLMRSNSQSGLRYWKKFIEISEKTNPNIKIEGLLGLAKFYFIKGMHKQSLPYYQSATSLSIQKYGRKSKQHGLTQSQFGASLLQNRKFDEALNLLLECDTILQMNFGKQSQPYLTNLVSIGFTYLKKGSKQQLQKAFQILNQCLKFSIKSQFRFILKITGQAYHRLGQLYLLKGYYQKTFECQSKIFQIVKLTKGKYDLFISVVYRTQALVYSKLQEFNKAIQQIILSIPLLLKVGDCSTEDYASALNNLAINYMKINQTQKGLRFLKKSYDITLARAGPSNVTTQISDMNIGIFYAKLKDTENALKILQKYTVMPKEFEGYHQYSYSIYLKYLTDIYIQQGRFQESLKFCEKAETMIASHLGKINIQYLQIIFNKGVTYKMMKNPEKAKQYFQKCLKYINSPQDHQSLIQQINKQLKNIASLEKEEKK